MDKYYKKSKQISDDLIHDIKYLYDNNVVGLIATLVLNYNLPLSQAVIDGVKDSLVDHFFDGMDPEWENYGMWQWFEGLNPDWFEIKSICNSSRLVCNKSPKDFKENEKEV